MCDVCEAEKVIGDTMTKGVCHYSNDRYHLEIQARGLAEGRATYRIRKPGMRWPKWRKTEDLVGAMATLGLDVKFKYMPAEMRAFITGRRKTVPTLTEIRARRSSSMAAWQLAALGRQDRP